MPILEEEMGRIGKELRCKICVLNEEGLTNEKILGGCHREYFSKPQA